MHIAISDHDKISFQKRARVRVNGVCVKVASVRNERLESLLVSLGLVIDF